MTRDEFYKLTGEYPEDILGPDWENLIEDYIAGENDHFHEGHLLGGCYICKMD